MSGSRPQGGSTDTESGDEAAPFIVSFQMMITCSDGNCGSLKGAGSYGSVPFREPFKRAVQKSRFVFKGAGLIGLSAK